jgi:hypothetical protein
MDFYSSDNPLGFHRTYSGYSPDGLKKLMVLEEANGRLRIKIQVVRDPIELGWLEEWSYSGAYTIIWPLEDLPEEESTTERD